MPPKATYLFIFFTNIERARDKFHCGSETSFSFGSETSFSFYTRRDTETICGYVLRKKT